MSSFFRPFKISAIKPEEPVEPVESNDSTLVEPPSSPEAAPSVATEVPEPESISETDSTEELPDEDEEAFLHGERHGYKILLLGALKLLWNLLFVYLFYDRIKATGIYKDIPALYLSLKPYLGEMTYRTFMLAGAGVSALLYLLILSQVKVRNRIAYAAFALLFLLDGIVLLQPTKELFTVLFCGLLLMLLRLRTGWRYLFSGLLVIMYALIMNHFVILLIPAYCVVRLWQKSPTWGVRLAVALLLGFCILYQTGNLMSLIDYRTEATIPYMFKKLFAPENYPGHVAYYLVDYLAVFGRLLVPYELVTQGITWTSIYAPIILALTIFLGYTLYYVITLDWKKPISHDNRILADVTAVFVILIAVQAFYEPGYVSAYRHMAAYYPLYLYLFFGANRRAPRPEIQRDFAGARPVIFFHKGDDAYVYDVLQHASKVCGHKNVILLGDESNQGFVSNWYAFSDYCTEEAAEFAKVYNHISDAPYEFELTCFQRHFALYAFMQEKGIEECFMCDSDVLIYEDLSTMDLGNIDFGCSNANYSVCMGECASPHCTYWKLPRLRQFLDFVLHVYRSKVDWLMEVNRRQKEAPEIADRNITDMILLTAWRKIVDDYDPRFRYRNFDRIEEGKVFDHCLSSADNLVPKEYTFRRLLGIKKIHFRGKQPILLTAEKETVQAGILHCQDCKEYIALLSRRSNCTFLYWLARVLY